MKFNVVKVNKSKYSGGMMQSEGPEDISVLIVGGGLISREYAMICSHLSVETTLISRGFNKDRLLDDVNYVAGDFYDLSTEYLRKFSHVIIAVQPRFTFEILCWVLQNSSAQILVEKPVCLSSQEFNRVDCDEFVQRVYVAFNRRFFASSMAAKGILADKPILTLEVCFTEMKSRMRGSEDELRLWGMCNTIHLFDMAFNLAGMPTNVEVARSELGGVDSYSVVGSLPNGLLAMNAHWGGPGNWGITVTTPAEKLFFDPLEKLSVQKLGSFKKEEIPLDSEVNGGFKNGFLAQTVDFLDGSKDKFISHANYKRLILLIEKIFK